MSSEPDRIAPSVLQEIADRYADGASTETDSRLLHRIAVGIAADIAERRDGPCTTCGLPTREASDHLTWCPMYD